MAFLYDPKTKKPLPVAIVLLILIPILLFVFVIVFGKQYADKQRSQKKGEETMDVFDKF